MRIAAEFVKAAEVRFGGIVPGVSPGRVEPPRRALCDQMPDPGSAPGDLSAEASETGEPIRPGERDHRPGALGGSV